jgi:hypothetical protein
MAPVAFSLWAPAHATDPTSIHSVWPPLPGGSTPPFPSVDIDRRINYEAVPWSSRSVSDNYRLIDCSVDPTSLCSRRPFCAAWLQAVHVSEVTCSAFSPVAANPARRGPPAQRLHSVHGGGRLPAVRNTRRRVTPAARHAIARTGYGSDLARSSRWPAARWSVPTGDP